MTSILCLAHYCDLHGPTPLMVTEGLPAPCSTCFDDPDPQESLAMRPNKTPTSAPGNAVAITDALRQVAINGHQPSDQESQAAKAAMLRASTADVSPHSPATAIETPPDSPRRAAELPVPLRRDSSNFRRTYDDTVTKRAGPCDNCAMTLPMRQSGKAERDGKASSNTLRTRIPCAKVYNSGEQAASPPPSQASSASDTDGEGQSRYSARRTTGSTTTRSSMSSTTRSFPSHTHYTNYTSTHEPPTANSFSIVRNSCLRALSLETLPRTPQPGAGLNTPTSPTAANPASQPFVTTHSAGAAASGGPILFGDPRAGYTIAYIFRIPDVHARGHKRVYAFLALSTHRERLIMKIFGFIAAAFNEMASWIQKLAEAEAEKVAEAIPAPLSGAYYGSGSGGYPPPRQSQERDRRDGYGYGYGGPDRGSGSSFLTGGSGFTRRMGGGAGGVSLKSRGLAELVGLPDFFIQLHQKFVQLLMELGIRLGS